MSTLKELKKEMLSIKTKKKKDLKINKEILSIKTKRALFSSVIWIIPGILFTFPLDLKSVIIWLFIISHIINLDWGEFEKGMIKYYELRLNVNKNSKVKK